MFSQLRIYGKSILVIVFYLIINSLFVIKYGARIEQVSVLFILFGYNVLVLVSLYLLRQNKDWINNLRCFNKIYIILALVFCGIFIAINYLIDGNSLNVDRWSALHGFIENILSSIYPYNVPDHLGQTTSNLPGLFYLGLPFYLIGSIGLIQPFVYGLLMFWVLKKEISNVSKLLFLTLIIFSPAFWWEVFAKSDLISNLFVVILFMEFWVKHSKQEIFFKPILLGLFSVILLFTRGIVAIPLTLFLFPLFVKTTSRKRLNFVFGGFLGFILLLAPLVFSIPDFNTLINHNPFNHQVRYAPKILIVLSLILPFLLFKKVKSIANVYYFSFLIIGILMTFTLMNNVLIEGFRANIYGDLFDISYLTMCLPFGIFHLILTKNTMRA